MYRGAGGISEEKHPLENHQNLFCALWFVDKSFIDWISKKLENTGKIKRVFAKILLNTKKMPLRKSSEEVIKGDWPEVEQPKKYKRQTSGKSAKTNRKDRREEKYARLL